MKLDIANKMTAQLYLRYVTQPNSVSLVDETGTIAAIVIINYSDVPYQNKDEL